MPSPHPRTRKATTCPPDSGQRPQTLSPVPPTSTRAFRGGRTLVAGPATRAGAAPTRRTASDEPTGTRACCGPPALVHRLGAEADESGWRYPCCVAHNVDRGVVRFSQSARKHRIGRAHALYVMDNGEPQWDRPAGKEPRLLWIGPDERGVELEVVAVQTPDYLLVIHVMPTALRGKGGNPMTGTSGYRLGPDVDLDVEDVRDADGTRITEDVAEQIAAEVLTRAGRPSLTGPGAHSPEIKARVPIELRDRLAEAARSRHTTASAIIREALEEYLAS